MEPRPLIGVWISSLSTTLLPLLPAAHHAFLAALRKPRSHDMSDFGLIPTQVPFEGVFPPSNFFLWFPFSCLERLLRSSCTIPRGICGTHNIRRHNTCRLKASSGVIPELRLQTCRPPPRSQPAATPPQGKPSTAPFPRSSRPPRLTHCQREIPHVIVCHLSRPHGRPIRYFNPVRSWSRVWHYNSTLAGSRPVASLDNT